MRRVRTSKNKWRNNNGRTEESSEGSIKAEKPQFNVGDTVRVDVRIKEGERERIQAFEGTVIAKKHGGVAETFTVRRRGLRIGIERVFPINSPFVEKVTVIREGKVRSRTEAASTCVAAPARLPRSRAISDVSPPRCGRKGTTLFVPFFFIKEQGAQLPAPETRCADMTKQAQSQQPPVVQRGQNLLEWYEALVSAALTSWCCFFLFLSHHSGGR